MDTLTVILLVIIGILVYLYLTKQTSTYTVPSEVVFEDDMSPDTVKELFVKVNQQLVTEMQGKVQEAALNSKSKDEIIAMSDGYHDRIAATSKSFAAWILKHTDFKDMPSA